MSRGWLVGSTNQLLVEVCVFVYVYEKPELVSGSTLMQWFQRQKKSLPFASIPCGSMLILAYDEELPGNSGLQNNKHFCSGLCPISLQKFSLFRHDYY